MFFHCLASIQEAITDGWCAQCSTRSAALEANLKKSQQALEAALSSQGILKVSQNS